jgi:hypothetical protein
MNKTLESQKPPHCYFWDPEAKAGRAAYSKCEGMAVTFVRKKHDGRLCPLCTFCKSTFTQARSAIGEDVKRTLPGHVEVDEVPLDEASVAEFRAQPTKK